MSTLDIILNSILMLIFVGTSILIAIKIIKDMDGPDEF